MLRKYEFPSLAFFIVQNGIPVATLGFSEQKGIMLGGILEAINNLTSHEVKMGKLSEIHAKSGWAYVSDVGNSSFVGFFALGQLPFALQQHLRNLVKEIGYIFLTEYAWNEKFVDALNLGSLPLQHVFKLAYDGILVWRKGFEKPPFKLTDTLERAIDLLDSSIIDEEEINIEHFLFTRRFEEYINKLTYQVWQILLKDDVSPLITAKNIEYLPIKARKKVESIVKEVFIEYNPAKILFSYIKTHYKDDLNWNISH